MEGGEEPDLTRGVDEGRVPFWLVLEADLEAGVGNLRLFESDFDLDM